MLNVRIKIIGKPAEGSIVVVGGVTYARIPPALARIVGFKARDKTKVFLVQIDGELGVLIIRQKIDEHKQS